MFMGGKKKPTLSQAERALRRAQMKEAEKRAQKKKEAENKERSKWAVVQTDIEAIKSKIASMNVITPFELASQLSISIGEAKRILNGLVSSGMLVRKSSFNGHPVYLNLQATAKS